jgi:hypothetical protein
MKPPEQKEVFRKLDFVGQQQADRLDALFASVKTNQTLLLVTRKTHKNIIPRRRKP